MIENGFGVAENHYAKWWINLIFSTKTFSDIKILC
jgi:hypothetical protein